MTPILEESSQVPLSGDQKSDSMPPLEFLQSARLKLHELYGPCAANSQILVIEVANAEYQEMLVKTKNS